MPTAPTSLSKSRYTWGKQCAKRLWLTVFEPDAPELVPDPVLQSIFDQGHEVGDLARREFPGGLLMSEWTRDKRRWARETTEAMKGQAPAIFEAAFEANGAFGAVDVLERLPGGGWGIVEVKSTLEVKDQYVDDVALQLFAARAAGADIRRVEVMHLNKDATAPDLSNLFVREDVTARAEEAVGRVAGELKRMQQALSGPMPDVKAGSHCTHPYKCPFEARCAPVLPEHHVSTLFSVRAKGEKYLKAGYTTIHEIPVEEVKSAVMARQVRAVQSDSIVVEDGLAEALRPMEGETIAFLDFESVNPAVPRWDGTRPLQHVPVQFSAHVVKADGAVSHHEFLAEPGRDPRPALAEALVDAVGSASRVGAYFASFEGKALDHLAEAVPERAGALRSIKERLVDLLPIVRENVYAPDFFGSFSLKSVAPSLLGMTYEGLDVGEGGTASVVLADMLLKGGSHDALTRHNLLVYCRQDTAALVALHEKLRRLAGMQGRVVRLPEPPEPPVVSAVVVGDDPKALATVQGDPALAGALRVRVNRANLEETAELLAAAVKRAKTAGKGLEVVSAFSATPEGARLGNTLEQQVGPFARRIVGRGEARGVEISGRG